MLPRIVERVEQIQSKIGGSWDNLTKVALMERLRNAYWQLDGLLYLLENSVLLFPDMTRKQHEAQEFCFADPCTLPEWNKLKAEASHTEGYLPFCYKPDGDEIVCIILRGPDDTDDDCLTTAAWIRMVREFTGMIYALPYSDAPALAATSMANIIARTAGVPFHQVRHIEV